MTTVNAHHDQGVGLVSTRYINWDEPLALDCGDTLAPITLAYETYGRLSPAGDNAILLLHALSGDAHAAGRHQSTDRLPGWWDAMVGPGRAFDTERYFVICSNIIGGCKGSTGPSSLDPATGQPYGARFPVITIADMVRAQVRLIDALKIDQLLAVAGGSMGGFQALQWVTAYPERVRGAVLIATSARSSVQTLAWNAIGRRAIVSDPRWRGGDYYGYEPPIDGLSVARMLGHITYLSEPLLEQKFGRRLQHQESPRFTLDPEFVIEHYLEQRGISFNARFDANSYLYISRAMDYWDLPAHYGSLEAALAQSRAHVLLISFSSDWLYPGRDSRLIADTLRQINRPVEHLEIETIAGHDAFLLDCEPQRRLVTAFLMALTSQPTTGIHHAHTCVTPGATL